jgi:hypothetical protein
MSKKYLYFVIVALILLPSCKKNHYYHYLSEDFKQSCLFEQGSYWIYQNDSTGIIDSAYISEPPVYDILISSNGVSEFETVTILFNSTLLRKFYMEGGRGKSYNAGDFFEYLRVFICDEHKNCTPWVGYFVNVIKGYKYLAECRYNEYLSRSWEASLKDIYPEYFFNQNTFKNVQFIRIIPHYNILRYDSVDVYYSKGKGIVRFIHYNVNGSGDTESWSLLRYRVVQ